MPMVRRSVEEPFDADPGLHAGQRTAGAAVDAAPEGEVLACIVTVDPEFRPDR